LQKLNLKRLAGVCINGEACGLIRQSTVNLTNVVGIIYDKSYLITHNNFNWYCMAVVSLCCEIQYLVIQQTQPLEQILFKFFNKDTISLI